MKEQNRETRTTETITISRAEYEELKSQNEWLMEQLRLMKKKQFGASSEQAREPLDGQMNLMFNEAEVYAAPLGPQKTTQVAAHTRKQSGTWCRITSRWRWWSTAFVKRSKRVRSAESRCAKSGQRYGRH